MRQSRRPCGKVASRSWPRSSVGSGEHDGRRLQTRGFSEGVRYAAETRYPAGSSSRPRSVGAGCRAILRVCLRRRVQQGRRRRPDCRTARSGGSAPRGAGATVPIAPSPAGFTVLDDQEGEAEAAVVPPPIQSSNELAAPVRPASKTEIAAVRQRITDWANAIPDHPHRDLGKHLTIQEAKVLTFFDVRLDAIREQRELRYKMRPCQKGDRDGDPSIKPEKIRIWEFASPLGRDLREGEAEIVVPRSERTMICPHCEGKKVGRCAGCGGEGKGVCPRCEGRGQHVCYACHGSGRYGSLNCPQCEGRGGLGCGLCRKLRAYNT